MAKLTAQDDGAALALREQGWSYRAIGRSMRVSDKTALAAAQRAALRRDKMLQDPAGEPEELTAEQSERLLEEEWFLAWVDIGHRAGYFTRCVLKGVPKVER
jgi:hypothetical protein